MSRQATLLFALLGLSRLALGQSSVLEDLDHQVTSLAARLKDSLVHITVQPSVDQLRRQRDNPEGDVSITVSGVVVSADGVIATVADPLKLGERYVVEFSDGRQEKASSIRIDEKTGIGFLRVKSQPLAVPRFTDGTGLATGSLLIALGHGRPQSATPSLGFVIGSRREAAVERTLHTNLLEVSAGTSADDRGGVLVRPSGDVAAMILGSPGQSLSFGDIPMNHVCFAIPIERVLGERDRALANPAEKETPDDHVDEKGWLGIRAQDITPVMRERLHLPAGGVLVQTVVEDSPAKKAGLKPNDVILTWAGEAVNDSLDLLARVELARAGTEVKLTVVRDGESLKMTLVLGEW